MAAELPAGVREGFRNMAAYDMFCAEGTTYDRGGGGIEKYIEYLRSVYAPAQSELSAAIAEATEILRLREGYPSVPEVFG